MRALVVVVVLFVALLVTTPWLHAQGRGGGPAAASGRAGAPVDLTGYWVSVITDFWRYRMLTPPKGNVDYLPVTPEARKVADAWDPARDEAAGEQCRGYGAVGVMRLPGRLRISWMNDNVMRLETDAGTQTRLFHFAEVQASAVPSWQGSSVARWARPFTPSSEGLAPQGELRVTTTRLRPGYIRKNGIPYSGDATLTEYFVRLVDDDGQQYLAVTQTLDDARYFLTPIVRTMLFKKQADASGWNPGPCSAR
jgi:hypothetical protein